MFACVRNHTRYDRNELMMYKKGIGPNSLGSPLKQISPKKDKPIYGGVLKEATVTAKKHPHPIAKYNGPRKIIGYPPAVGVPKIAAKGFQLAKMAVSKLSKYAPKTAEAVGEVLEGKQHYDKIKGRFK